MKFTREDKIVVVAAILRALEAEGAFDNLNIIEQVLASDELGEDFISEVGPITNGDTEVAFDKMTEVCCKILESLKGDGN